jgi:hypothetical protein
MGSHATGKNAALTSVQSTPFDRTLGRILLGSGLTSVFAGGYFGVRAWQGARELETGCPSEPCHPELAADYRTARRDAALANWLVGVGVAVTGVGAYFTLRDASSRRGTTGPAWLVHVLPGEGATVGCAGSF